MEQIVPIFLDESHVNFITIPSPETEILPGVQWGKVEFFYSPAYWYYQVLSKKNNNSSTNHKLGGTFLEEVCACLLGGYGIPAYVGLAAFNFLKSKKIFSNNNVSEEEIFNFLSQPLNINGKKIKYRFAKQKSRYIINAIRFLKDHEPPFNTGKELRDWLLQMSGIGYKTASWIARNWLNANDVAILDIHILRAGQFANFLDKQLTVQKDYLTLENQFLEFANALGVNAYELDAVIWYDMMLTTNIFKKIQEANFALSGKGTTNNSHSNPKQIKLI
ncbi:TPA: 8-oxoguanine DNA glycosylase [Pasteurella multocida]|uniref:8-oxoguanine DNA glycosylase n=1 Tax=Pasteurella multocida TaxID=747 RepID=UPI003305465B|nr:8-oxoguanine DNA glycosylase [Pasteurella multocida]HDR1432934.1 8-oxoguanine DNA glycosylase [Pasteurella multocida]HDR1791949.1 8-oxoguanine DNA glycosylase [Pasteurella multocida]HDR1830063.1 8-oxoguanine DNA glycosylase [Pasteurella multocida]HDR1857131.1 8-oxoguanine DNA glycosylase [Pasteurella multocida]